jgi:uncharacterized protein YdaU (DUF1376 family)
MSRPFIAFYTGDYQRKTQHLDTLQHGALFLLLQHCWTHGSIPLEPASRAAITRMTLPAWKKIASVIDAFFDAEGRNKRATEEIQKAEVISTKRALAGRKGGIRSGISKAAANGKQMLQQTESKPVAFAVANDIANGQQSAGICEAIQNISFKTSTGRVGRGDGEKPKPPNLTTVEELDALIAARRLQAGRATA